MTPELTQIQVAWKRARLLLLAIVFLFIAWFVYNYGFISVEVSGNNNEKVIVIIDDKGKEKTSKTTNTSVRILVKRGEKQIIVTDSDGANKWIAKKSGGFLMTTKINTKLLFEAEREYVAKNPKGCSAKTPDLFLSYDCGGTLDSLTVHVPATEKIPQYTKSVVNTGASGQIESVFVRNGKLFIVAYIIADPGYHYLYSVSAGSRPELINESAVDLPDTVVYQSKTFGSSPVFYTDELSFAYMLDNENTIQEIPLGKLSDQGRPLAIDYNGTTTIRAYSEVADIDIHAEPGQQDYIYIDRQGKSTKASINQTIVTANFCGAQKNLICVVWVSTEYENSMSVYEIQDDNSISTKYTVSGIRTSIPGNKYDLLLTNKGVVGFNAEVGEGHYLHTNGSYVLCGVTASQDIVTVCLKTGALTFALNLYDLEKDTKPDEIDKKVFKLFSTHDIESVSVYKNLVFITPRLKLTQINNRFEYDPVQKARAAKNIDSLVERQGIDTNKYTIVNLRK